MATKPSRVAADVTGSASAEENNNARRRETGDMMRGAEGAAGFLCLKTTTGKRGRPQGAAAVQWAPPRGAGGGAEGGAGRAERGRQRQRERGTELGGSAEEGGARRACARLQWVGRAQAPNRTGGGAVGPWCVRARGSRWACVGMWALAGTCGHVWARVGHGGHAWVTVGTRGHAWVTVGMPWACVGHGGHVKGTCGHWWALVGTGGHAWALVGTAWAWPHQGRARALHGPCMALARLCPQPLVFSTAVCSGSGKVFASLLDSPGFT